MCKNVKQNVLFERSEFIFCSFCMCKSRPETKSEDEAPKRLNDSTTKLRLVDYSDYVLMILLMLEIIKTSFASPPRLIAKFLTPNS